MSGLWVWSLLQTDPNAVAPGPGPLILTVLLGAALVLLYLSLRRQVRKIRLPGEDDVGGERAPEIDIKNPPPQ